MDKRAEPPIKNGVKVNDRYYATNPCVVKDRLIQLRCRKYRKEKCKFRLSLRSIYLHDPALPGYFDPKNFDVLPGKHGHICPGYNSELLDVNVSKPAVGVSRIPDFFGPRTRSSN